MVGGFGEVQDADDTVQSILGKVQAKIEEKEKKEFEKFNAVKYSKQVVNGFNYLIKAETDDGYMHVQVYVKSEEFAPSLKGYESGKSLEDALTPVGKHKPVPLPGIIGPKPRPGPPGCECSRHPQTRPLIGGFGEIKDADDKVKEVLGKIRSTLEEKEGKTFETFEAISFKTQIVAGTNYLIKVQYDDGYLHALVFEPLPHTAKDPELTSYVTGKLLEDELQPPISSKPLPSLPAPPPPGAFGETKDADEEVKNLVATYKKQITKNLKEKTKKLNAISYAKQIVSGTNYVIKVETDNDYLHVAIYKPPPLTKMATIVKKVETGKTLEDDLVPPMPCKCPRMMAGTATRPGGFGVPQEMDEEVEDVLELIREEVETREGKTFETFQGVKYVRQIVAGTKFIIKVQTEDGYLHLHVFRPLPHVSDKPQLEGYESGKTLDDLLLPIPEPAMMPGGYSEPQPPNQQVRDALELIQDELELQEGKKFTTFEAVSFISQTVAGTNFLIKVQTDDGYLHALVFRPLPHTQQPTQLMRYETGKTEEDILLPPPPPIICPGMYGEVREPTQEVRDALELVQDELEQREGKQFTIFEAVSFISQPVVGTNFVIKVQTDDGYLHALVFRPLPHAQEPTQLITYETGKTEDDELFPPPGPKIIMAGGYGEVKEADEKVAEILDSVRDELEEKEAKEFETFKAHSYITQVVAGTNYRIKVETEDGYLHVLVFEPLPSEEADSDPELVRYETGLKLEDSLLEWEAA